MAASTDGNLGPSQKLVEAGVALLIGATGVVVIIGSIKAGIGWGAEGPRAGFFPFYIGLSIVGASVVNLISALRARHHHLFAEWSQLGHVMSVLIPSTLFVGAMPFIGLYVSSALFIGWFMRWLGKYRWLTVLAVAIGAPVITYLVFERWFLVPLPKGPLEDLLGL
ncbi:tripartite tricarboxylate transporter TctB family protein [Rhodopseudomonas palustris]|uniref:Tripartite tricarboxylate transporter TctB family protein n=1 Tax=Rhodopseudomonas palustris TaxID=1076 RepID=A0A418V2G7_RHOPL|nr:tripartite tricarboxylate transporter TctB family protein [Rhodopseudomonas palustris]RJF70242.1 tripartite tricarboxylate transporter TctB family protein [Rhodopseudomonas palustris]